MSDLHSSRVVSSLSSREVLANDFFGGWELSDLDLFKKYAFAAKGTPGFITDYFGVKTSVDFVPWAKSNSGGVFTDPPLPDDGVRAEAIEYFALLDALERSANSDFTAVEVGSSYAPWACAAGVLALRQGKRKLSLRAVEASSFFYALIADNFSANGLVSSVGDVVVDIRSIHGAAGIKPGNIYFPVVSSAFENGGRVSNEKIEIDYVGRKVAHEEVPVRTLDEIFEGLEFIDFLHCDIQGAEGEFLTHGAAIISQKVRCMFVGTHSRLIEGILIDCFHKHGWKLVRERPVDFRYRSDLDSVVGMTIRDGGQYWINGRFANNG